jgi:hypothetical protein
MYTFQIRQKMTYVSASPPDPDLFSSYLKVCIAIFGQALFKSDVKNIYLPRNPFFFQEC